MKIRVEYDSDVPISKLHSEFTRMMKRLEMRICSYGTMDGCSKCFMVFENEYTRRVAVPPKKHITVEDPDLRRMSRLDEIAKRAEERALRARPKTKKRIRMPYHFAKKKV